MKAKGSKACWNISAQPHREDGAFRGPVLIFDILDYPHFWWIKRSKKLLKTPTAAVSFDRVQGRRPGRQQFDKTAAGEFDVLTEERVQTSQQGCPRRGKDAPPCFFIRDRAGRRRHEAGIKQPTSQLSRAVLQRDLGHEQMIHQHGDIRDRNRSLRIAVDIRLQRAAHRTAKKEVVDDRCHIRDSG